MARRGSWRSDKLEKVGEGQSWKSGRVLILFKGWGCRVSPRLHVRVSDINHGNNGVGWVHYFLSWPQGWKDFP